MTLATVLRKVGANIMGTGLVVLGVLCVMAPSTASAMYGLPAKRENPWVIVAGIRDFGLGIATLMLNYYEPRSLRVFVPSVLLVAVGDAMLTITQGGTVPEAGAHIGGSVAIIILTIVAWLDRTLGEGHAKAS